MTQAPLPRWVTNATDSEIDTTTYNPQGTIDFKATHGPASVVAPENPEAAIAFPETWLRERLNDNGLAIREPIQWGNWRGIQNPYQDIVVVGPAA